MIKSCLKFVEELINQLLHAVHFLIFISTFFLIVSPQIHDLVHYVNKNNSDTDRLIRYSRQLTLPEIGQEGQVKLNRTKVLIVGAGGLDSPVIQHLTAIGVGTIRITDFDNVELFNLRQVLFSEEYTGKPKAELAARYVKNLNSDIDAEVITVRVDADNSRKLVNKNDIVVDCIDNFETRYALKDACLLEDKPLFSGQPNRHRAQRTDLPALQ